MTPAGDLHRHPRLDRPGRGRADPPADRAARHAAGDPQLGGAAPGRRHRDGGGVAVAIERTDGPTALVLTRQKLPVLDRSVSAPAAAAAARGLRPLRAADGPEASSSPPGPEVHVALEAAEPLAGRRACRPGSCRMPSWELFAAQSQDYRDEVLPPAITRPGRDRGGLPVRLGALGRHRWRRGDRHRPLRRLGAGRAALRTSSVSRRSTPRTSFGACATERRRYMTQSAGPPGRAGPEPLVRLHHPRPDRARASWHG